MAVCPQELADQVRRLVFEVTPEDFAEEMAAVVGEWETQYAAGTQEDQDAIAAALVELSADIVSYLPRWNLQDEDRYPEVLDTEELIEAAATNCELLEGWGRLEQAKAVQQVAGATATSNLVEITRMTDDEVCNVRWGNDYASGLKSALRRGATLVTTNPQLVNVARTEHPDMWDPVKARLKAEHADADPLQLASLMTMQVVAENARLIRPIWEITGGELGYVSLQLNPTKASDPDAMVDQAEWIFSRMGDLLGGTPNIVFKVPGTKAGLEAAARLTSQAMGVNITVNYSLPQQIAFAEVIEKHSTAQVSFRTQMDGRVDDPIGEELAAAGVEDALGLKTWATAAMRRREFAMLLAEPDEGGRGYKKSFPLGAAGRGPWNITRSLWNGPVTEFITIFPNRQEQFDAIPRVLDPNALDEPVDEAIIKALRQSKIFCQMYEPDGLTVDEFDDFLPCRLTLKQFSEQFEDFVKWLSA